MGPAQPAFAAAFLTTLTAASITDLDRRLIPNRILLASAATAIGIVAIAAPATLPARLLAAAFAGGVLLGATIVRPGGMGLGDVKLAAVMGLYLGAAVASALFVALALGAAVGAAIIGRHGTAGRKRTIPFAPFLAAGGLVAIAVGDEIVDWYLHTALQ